MLSIEVIQRAIRLKYGEDLAKIERWSTFRKEETSEEWVAFLGKTAVVDSHQEYMVEFFTNLVQSDDTITDDDKYLLRLALSFHDIGEIDAGDTPNPEKTSQTDENEWAIAIVLLTELAKSTGFQSLLINTYIDVVAGENQKLHHLFKAVERTEYFDTAMHGFQYLMKSHDASPNKWLLVARVLAFDLPKVIQDARSYPQSIGRYLKENTHTINQMFVQAKENVTADFVQQYDLAQSAWQNHFDSNVLR